MSRITERVCPVPREVVERAVECCDLEHLRGFAPGRAKFFRRGVVGAWRDELSDELIELLRRTPPYPDQFAALGYNLDPEGPPMTAPRSPRSRTDPFRNVDRFDNGVLVPAAASRLYLSLDARQACRRWPDIRETGAGSFYHWLNSPAEGDPYREEPLPILTNLAAFLVWNRPRFRESRDEMWARSRMESVRWILHEAADYHGLDDAFIEPVRTSYLDWANAVELPSGTDPPVPEVTRLAVHVYSQRTDLHATIPDLDAWNRITYLLWFVQHGVSEQSLDPAVVEPVRQTLLAWGSGPDSRDPRPDAEFPVLNLTSYLHARRHDLRKTLPDLHGKDRVAFVVWLLEHGYDEHGIGLDFLRPQAELFFAWANRPDPDDPQPTTSAPALTNLATFLYRRDGTLLDRFPDVYGEHRVDYLIHFIIRQEFSSNMKMWDPSGPILQWWATLPQRRS